ncbi:MAG: SDR family NAD(P)-dependent oxidoreductase, partial [Anaerolineaceae bacterium]|nr:SDR family NAD(P)-dependent oxidoreductase [Anaerolineaceae bacterium]
LVARRREKLTALAAELIKEYTIHVDILPSDLSGEAGIHRVEERIRVLSRLDYLINNAGFGLAGEFIRQSMEKNLAMLQVHCATPARLAHAALPGMLAHGGGVIINVSSISAFTPMAGNVQYCATKDYLVTFSRALQLETHHQGIKIQALCPGFFHSEFHTVMRANKKSIPAWLFMPADEVARRSLAALRNKRVIYTPGFLNQLVVFVVRLPGLGNGLLTLFARQIARRRRDFLKVRE